MKAIESPQLLKM